jgi:hypothetical protein
MRTRAGVLVQGRDKHAVSGGVDIHEVSLCIVCIVLSFPDSGHL